MMYQEITGEVIGCAMEVHRTLGCGFQEYVYQRALEIELQKKKIKHQREFDIKIYYKGEYIALRRIDFLVGAKSLQFKRLYNKKSPLNQIQSNES